MTNRLVLALLLSLITAPIQAMRCGNRLVQEGDTKLEVLRKCGEPTLSEGSGIVEQEDEIAIADKLNDKLLLIGRQQSRFSQPVETWHYNCGSNRFARVLTFVGPYLGRIETSEQGFGTGGCKQPPLPTHNNSVRASSTDSAEKTRTTDTPRGVLDAAIEFRQLHQHNLEQNSPGHAGQPPDSVYRWQDERGQWHYSATPAP